MKKILLTSALAMMMAMPAMAAVDIAPSATTADCDSGVLKTTSGSANLEANWDANTINLNWYAGSDSDTPLTVQTGAQTCTYDGAITLPATQPTKPGYTFDHWIVRSCFAGVDTSITGSGRGYWDFSEDAAPFTNTYNLTSAGQWATEFSYGVVRGIASCNDTGESIWTPINTSVENGTMTEEQAIAAMWGPNGTGFMPNGTFNSNSTGRYCWCQVTSLTPNGGNACSVASSSWVFGGDYDDASNCAYDCAEDCAGYALSNPSFRAAVYGVTQ